MATGHIHALLERQRDRKARQGQSSLAALIAAPHDLTTSFILPGQCELFVKAGETITATASFISIAGISFGVPALATNEFRRLGLFNKGVLIDQIETGFDYELYAVVGFEKLKIAELTGV